VVFCEVKSKRGRRFGLPEEMVDREKERRLRRAAEAWLARNRGCDGLEVGFEVVAIDEDGLRRLPLGDPL
jgi:putative endonuclease